MKSGKQNKIETTDNQITVKVVASIEDLMKVFAVRSVVFMENDGLPLGVACDGNDFQATHILMECDGEPIGCIRIRWFQDFAHSSELAFAKLTGPIERCVEWSTSHMLTSPRRDTPA